MAGRPRKRLLDYVREGTFRAREDGHLLGEEPDLPWPAFAALQRQYRQASSEPERRAIALNFERLVRQVHAKLPAEALLQLGPSLDEELAALGPAGSLQQVVNFFPRFLTHYQASGSAGQPFRLARFQREFLAEFWRRDRYGRRVYQVGLLGIPKGNGKTAFAAGLGLYALLSEPNSPDVYGIAGSREQAAITFSFARRWAEEGELASWLTPGRVLRCPERKGAYRILSSDGRLAQGVSPSAAIVDEWWLFEHARERESYNALAQALHKRLGESWLLAITTAGWNTRSQLGETYTAALQHPKLEVRNEGCLLVLRDAQAGFLMHWYGLPEGAAADIEDPKVIRACNPAPWVSPAALIRELHRPDVDERDWRRLHLNQWLAVRESWLPSGCWAGLGSEAEIAEGAEIYVGVDVGWYHDSTAVAWAHRLEDGRIVLRAKVWTTDPEQLGEYVAGGRMRLELVEDFVRSLRDRYRVPEIAFDPNYFGRSADILEAAGGVELVEMVPSGGPMVGAWTAFYQAAKEGTITHDRDPVLAAHVEGAAADRTERGLRVRKLKSSCRIDALSAAVMAHARCQLKGRQKPTSSAPQIFWMTLDGEEFLV